MNADEIETNESVDRRSLAAWRRFSGGRAVRPRPSYAADRGRRHGALRPELHRGDGGLSDPRPVL